MSTKAQIDARQAVIAAVIGDAATPIGFNGAARIWSEMAAALNAALPTLRTDGGADPGPLVARLTTIVDDAIAAIPEIHALRDAAAAMVPDDPVVTPPDPPVPPATPPRPASWTRKITTPTPVCFVGWYGTNDRYERGERNTILKGTTGTLEFRRFVLGPGGDTPLEVGTYRLRASGVEIASVAVASGARSKFTFPLDGLAEGHYEADIVTPGEQVIPWAFYVQKGDVPIAQAWMPAITGSYTLDNLVFGVAPNTWREVRVDWVPATFAPVAHPLTTPRLYQKPTVIAQSAMNCEELCPVRWGDIHRPNRNKDGLISSFDAQAYFFQPTFIGKTPNVALLDGPRGVGALAMITDLKASQAVVNGVQVRTVYFCTPWSFGKFSEDGTITTLGGLRNKGVMHHWEDVPSMFDFWELVGDWSRIPVERRGFRELWGQARDERSFVLDPDPSHAINGIPPHLTDGRWFFADTQNNRILLGLSSKDSHTAPIQYSEFIVNVLDPFDLVCVNGELIFTERKANRIVAYSADTGAFLRVIAQGAALAAVNTLRDVVYAAGQNPLTCQAQPCVCPEGLFFQDDWLHFTSKAQQQRRKIRPDGTELTVVNGIAIDGNSRFAKLALDDGSFYDRGSSLTTTWSNGQNGGPQIHGPDGKVLPGFGGGNTGGTGDWVEGTRAGYSTASCVAHGAVIFANSSECCIRVTRTQPGDVAQTAAVIAGRNKWHFQQFEQRYGHGGFSLTGEALPWGQDADIDKYLQFKGHVRP